MSDRIERAFARNRRRRRVARLIYFVFLVVLGIALWLFLPREVIDTVRKTYFDPDGVANLNASN